jgi:CubicO group peptidase (beta-lactamase class C family)
MTQTFSRRLVTTGATIGALALLAFVGACSPGRSQGDLSHAIGFWQGAPPSQVEAGWTLVYEIVEVGPRRLAGHGYWYREGRMNADFPLDEVAYHESDHSLHVRYARVVFDASVDPFQGTATGTYSYPGGSEVLTVTRVAESSVPGLYPRTATAGEPYTYEYRAPEDAGYGWAVASLEDVGIDRQAMETLVAKIVARDFGYIHSLLIVRHGKLALEEYFYGYDREALQPIQSCTKSVASLLVGIAIDRGEIASVDQEIYSFFPEYERFKTAGWEDVKLEHILSMTAGLDWPRDWGAWFYTSRDYFGEVLKRPVVKTPGSEFDYVSPNATLLAGVIKHGTTVQADVFAERRLFRPLRITDYDWNEGRQNGYPRTDGTLKLRPRDMAKIGALVLGAGEWNGVRIVSEAWIQESTTPYATDAEHEGYGYAWWSTEREFDGRQVKAIFARGEGDQFIIVFPELDLVVVTTGRNMTDEHRWATRSIVEEHILPAISVE